MKRKLFLVPLIVSLLSTSITAFAEDAAIQEENTYYNETNSVSVNALPSDVQSITITPVSTQIIPTTPFKESLVNNAEVLYRFRYKVTAIRYNNQKVTNTPLSAFSYTGPVKGSKTTAFDSSGNGYIDVDIRGPKTFSLYCRMGSTNSNTITQTPSLRCDYQNSFYCTGYNIALESDYSDAKINASGITDSTFRGRFLAAVKLNGSGKAENGKYIKYIGSDTYSYSSPMTATGTTPTAGTTIAVDPYFIPRAKVGGLWKRATVQIANVGSRRAEDGGNAINGYRIDVFRGIGNSSMSGWTNGNRAVTLISVG